MTNRGIEILAEYTIFGQTRMVKVITYTDGKCDKYPKLDWSDEIWVERGEDYYGIPRKGTVRVIEREDWMRANCPTTSKHEYQASSQRRSSCLEC